MDGYDDDVGEGPDDVGSDSGEEAEAQEEEEEDRIEDHIEDDDDKSNWDELGGSVSGTYELPNYDPEAAGDPEVAADMEVWHPQEEADTCAIASQEFILDSLSDGAKDWTEDELREEAEAAGWYTPGGGTPMADVGKLLEYHGLEVEQNWAATIDDLESRLAGGEKVIVGVDSAEIWTPGQDEYADDQIGDFPGIPGQGADHAVEVLKVDRDHPDGPMVVLNDPGHPDGRGAMIPLAEFEDAWADSGGFMVSASGTPSSEPGPTWWTAEVGTPGEPVSASLGGYYNGDGTYHWDSDNTDRDPQTGAVVRRW